MCGATSYRAVIARDDSGAMRPSGLFQCSGCSVVFADPKAWREGGINEVPPAPLVPVRPPVAAAMAGPIAGSIAGSIAAGAVSAGARQRGHPAAGRAAPE